MSLENVRVILTENGQAVEKQYRPWELKAMKRDEIRPVARQIAIEREADIDRTWLWNARPELQAAFILEEESASAFPRRGGLQPVMVQRETEEIQGSSNGSAPVSSDPLVSALIGALQGKLTAQGVDREAVIEIVREETAQAIAEAVESLAKVVRVELVKPDGTTKLIDGQHKQFAQLLAFIAQRENVYLVGPAASGKTQVAENVAKELGVEFSSMSVTAQTPVSAFFGFMNAGGAYVTTEFRKRFEFGGVFLCDEFDNGNANTCGAINQATSNSVCAFPDGMIQKHADFICIAAGNTYGQGADRQYVGRNQLDGATLDRFAFLPWNYDEDLELAIGQVPDWTKYVQKVRKAVFALKVRHIVSMRASLKGGKMLGSGMDRETVEETILWKGLAPEEKAKILAYMVNL